MDPSFRSSLVESGMPVGGHALLWEMWEREYSDSPRVPSDIPRAGAITPYPSPSPSASGSSSSSFVLSSPCKELFKRYQLKMRELKAPKDAKEKPSKASVPPKQMKIHLGGMVFDKGLKKGVKKRYIPPSQFMSFQRSAPYDLIIQEGKEVFFPENSNEADCFCLADSGSMAYDIGNKSDWVLSECIKKLKQAPSKLRIYIMYQPKEEVGDDVQEPSCTSHPVSPLPPNSPPPPPPPPPPLVHANDRQENSVIKECIMCGQRFRTYLPEVDTVMPDGASFFYSQPQNECPECGQFNWGWQWNIDLFSQFANYQK